MKVLMIGPIERVGGVSTHTIELTKALRKLGVEVEIYNISPSKEYPNIISNLIKLYKRTLGLLIKLIIARNFNIVHIQSSGPLGGFIPAIVSSLLRKFLNFPMVVTFHYSNTRLFVNNHKFLVSFVIGSSDKFIVVSSHQKLSIVNTIEKYGEKISVIPNGFNPLRIYKVAKEEARRELDLNLKDKIIINIALLFEKKGQKYLIDAMDFIINKYGKRNVKCFIAGTGPLMKELQKQIDKLGIHDYVKLLGFVPDEELPLWMNAADLFVLPSLSEGNPTVMFEALGVGLPFVGTAVGGVPEVIVSEDYGLLCPPADPECLAKKILIALEKEWDREKIRKYAEQFTWENIARKIIEIYKHVLHR